MSAIRFSGIAKSFGPTPVLTALDLEVREGEFMVLVGPSGCGKSTALRLIAGLEEPSAGEIVIGGRRVNDVAPKDRDVAMVFQSYALYPHMTVRENIAFGLRIRDVPAAEIESRVADAAGVLGLAELLERKPKALSGGQRQRVALGRAIVRKPSVFLFDEPLSNLDAELRVQMRAELSALQQRLGTTTVYVTHDQVEAMTLGHRIAVLAPTGAAASPNLQQVGAPLEIYDRPANAFVARFIGSPPMNVFAATLSADGARVSAPGFDAPVPAAFRAAAARSPGQGVLVGLRPEHIGPDAREAEVPVTLAGRVEIAETVGSEVIVHLRVGAERVLARYATRQVPKLGTPLELVGDGARLHLFDARDSRRLPEG